ncbi:hypothetical protein Ait01nite_019200 [Actinoplanes italicus]|nr:hypothetical protein Ait01nite_019200 [Actinoplanes italicus]
MPPVRTTIRIPSSSRTRAAGTVAGYRFTLSRLANEQNEEPSGETKSRLANEPHREQP